MSKIGINIRKIRTVKGLSQTAFADLFDIKRANIGAYEEGRAEPKLDLTLKIAKYFSISIESLLTKEVTVNEIVHFPQPGKDGVTLSKKDQKNHLFVSSAETQHYIINEHKEDTQKISIPKIISKATHLFELNNTNYVSKSLGENTLFISGNKIALDTAKDDAYLFVLSKGLFIGKFSFQGDNIEVEDHFSSEKSIFSKDHVIECFEIVAQFTKQLSPIFSTPLSDMEKRLQAIERQLKL